jgi:hypothetical protein
LYFPLVALLDFAGRRLVAQSILPLNAGIGDKANVHDNCDWRTRKISSLVYGSADAARHVSDSLRYLDRDVYSGLVKVCKQLNLRKHLVGTINTPESERKRLLFCADFEIHQVCAAIESYQTSNASKPMFTNPLMPGLRW